MPAWFSLSCLLFWRFFMRRRTQNFGFYVGWLVGLVFCCRYSRKNHHLFALSIVIITVAFAFSFATGKLHGRYIAVLSPLLVCVTVVMLSYFSRGSWGIFLICAVFFGIYLGHIEKTMNKVNLTLHDYTYSSVKRYVHLIDKFKNKGDYVVLYPSSLVEPMVILTLEKITIQALGSCRTMRAEAKIWKFETRFWLV